MVVRGNEGIRLLLMEDDRAQARLVQRSLERTGYTVTVVHDGDSGIAQYEAEAYDLLIVDHQMPGQDGLQVLHSLAARGAMPPAIMVTGHGDEAIAVEALQLGAGDYVVKDVEGRFLTLLPTIIAQVLRRHRLEAEKRQAEEQLKDTLETLESRVRERTAELQRLNRHLQAEIAERQRTEAALDQEHQFVTALLDTVSALVVVLDTQGRIVRFNRACEHLSGYSFAEVQGHCLWELVMPPEEVEAGQTAFARLCHEASPTTFENVWVSKRGERHLIVWSNTVLVNRQGAVQYVIGTGIDITARRHMEQDMQQADRLALVGQLASGMAHEIGTPLNVIAGNAELLRLELQGQGFDADELETIIKQADRITGLIERLLSFARPKTQTVEALSLHEPLSQALCLLEPRFRHQDIVVLVDIPAALPLVAAAPDQLEQVFLNILVNAWHAMPHGGRITIAAGTADHNAVQIAFWDTGQGMEPAELAQAFLPFYSTKGEQGTGLGLAICQQIIESHRGNIRLASTPGVGTTVTITLPRVEVTEQRSGA